MMKTLDEYVANQGPWSKPPRRPGHVSDPVEDDGEQLKNDIVARLLAGPMQQGITPLRRQKRPMVPTAFDSPDAASPDIDPSLGVTLAPQFIRPGGY